MRWALRTALVIAVVCVLAGCGRVDTAGRTPRSSTAPPVAVSRPDVGFRTTRRLDEHYAEHGGEFGSVSRDEYLRLAQTLRDRPTGGSVLEVVRRDDTVTRFDRTTGAFVAFERDGVIRTFFRPNDGERYFERQARR